MPYDAFPPGAFLRSSGGSLRGLLRVDSYEIDPHLADAAEVVLSGAHLAPSEVCQDSPIALAHMLEGRNNVLRVVADCAYTNTSAGIQSAVCPPCLREFRAAGTE